MSLNFRDGRDMGYDRRVTVPDDPPSEELLRMYGSKVAVVLRGPVPLGREPLCSVGEVHLLLAERNEVKGGPDILALDPVICWKRGVAPAGATGGEEDFAGIDDAVCTPEFWTDAARDGEQVRPLATALKAFRAPRTSGPPTFGLGNRTLREGLHVMGLPQARSLLKPQPATAPVRIALIDSSFAGPIGSVLPASQSGDAVAIEPGLEYPADSEARPNEELGHGSVLAAALAEALGPGCEFRYYRLAHREGALACGWLDATALAVALGRAGAWGADVIIVPMSEGHWGCPEHLRVILRELWRTGRKGKGIPVFCSVGSSDKNHTASNSGSSSALGADDLASQAWVQAVAATDEEGRWYRRYLRVEESTSPLGRFGPGVALSALGAVHVHASAGGMDDTSLASCLVAATGALVLQANPELTVVELRALLQRTCDVPPVVDDGPGRAAEHFNAWDRQGHNFKLGSGRVNALAAVLAAADPVCQALLMTRPSPGRVPTLAVADSDPALRRALAWFQWARAKEGTEPAGSLLARYLALRGRMARLLVQSLALQDAVGWVARHLMAVWVAEVEPSRAGPQPDHRALLFRLRDTLQMLEWEAHRVEEGGAIAPWARDLGAVLEDTPAMSTRLERFFFGTSGGPWGV